MAETLDPRYDGKIIKNSAPSTLSTGERYIRNVILSTMKRLVRVPSGKRLVDSQGGFCSYFVRKAWE
jgi:hypothetical protein